MRARAVPKLRIRGVSGFYARLEYLISGARGRIRGRIESVRYNNDWPYYNYRHAPIPYDTPNRVTHPVSGRFPVRRILRAGGTIDGGIPPAGILTYRGV